jgi:hypothetical protein
MCRRTRRLFAATVAKIITHHRRQRPRTPPLWP